MPGITKPVTREIIDDFAKEIAKKRQKTARPSKTVINFRTEKIDGFEREVWRVPIDILRYRKDNGRIASDVLDYERTTAVLDEKDENAQLRIQEFLEKKDPERTTILMKSILHAGQQEPAIITCDGFLINGNRRKMVMERLCHDYPTNDDIKFMKVVILPGKDEEGGPPTLLEIEQIENRYQLQSEGKSEYYRFDRALSIKRKVELGFSLEQQLLDDPRFVRASPSELKKAVKECKKDFLQPLACTDRYLKQFKREGLYRTISTGMSDPEGRWQAFVDYSNTYTQYFKNAKRLIEYGIEENEIGAIEEAAFDIIRLRTVPDMPKVHKIMRDLPKYCRTKEGKKAIKKITDEVDSVLSNEECVSESGKPLSIPEIDAKWAAKNKQSIIYNVKTAFRNHEALKEKETPLDLLDAAYKKLTHENMDLSAIRIGDHDKARKLAAEIEKEAVKIQREIYHYKKDLKKLTQKRV
jgi:hypothetical protein